MAMNTPLPIYNKDEMNNNLKLKFKEILIKHLDDRSFKDEKVKSWTNNILNEAKEYFIKKYPDYNIFLLNFIYPKNIYFLAKDATISVINSDCCNFVNFSNDGLYCCLYYFFYKNYNFNFNLNLDDYESEIIQKVYEILGMHLDERKFVYDKLANYNKNINEDITKYILEKEKNLRCFCINEIYQNPIKGKYYFKYLNYRKQIYSKFFFNYTNDSLICRNSIYFFK